MGAIADPEIGFHNPYCQHEPAHRFCPSSPEQQIFSTSPAFEGFFGGAAGPGKSILLLHEGVRQIDNRAYRGILFRRSYNELDQLIEMSQETFPHLGGRFNKSEHKWTFPLRRPAVYDNLLLGRQPGATFKLDYCDRDDHKYRHQGKAYAYIGWDELTQYPNSSVYEYLFLRCRPLFQGAGVRCYVRAASNPGGPGHAWVKQRLIEGREPFRLYWETVEDPYSGKKHFYLRQFIPATLESNKHMDPMYEVRLLAYPDPEIRRAMRYGDWDIAAGVMFAELRDGVHRIATRPPLDWTQKEIIVDWAYNGFAVAGWFETTSGMEGMPHSVQYREMVVSEVPPPLFARMLIDRTPEAEGIRGVTIDSAAFATPQDGGPSPAEQMRPTLRERGWSLVPATKGAGSRVRGWQLLHTYFFARRQGGPLLRIMDNCPVSWLQLTSLARGIEPHDIEDLEPNQTDDAADMVRYFVQGRPVPAAPTEAEILMADEKLDKLVDPRTYWAARIDELRQVGFPQVSVKKQKKPARGRKGW